MLCFFLSPIGVVPPRVQAHKFLDNIAKEAPEDDFEPKFYPGEGHYWLLASTIEDALQREHAWYTENIRERMDPGSLCPSHG